MMAQPSAEAPKADVANRSSALSDDNYLEASASSSPSTTDLGATTTGRAPIAATEETPTTILTGTVLGPDGDPYSGCHVVVMLQPMSEAFERRTGPPIPPWTTHPKVEAMRSRDEEDVQLVITAARIQHNRNSLHQNPRRPLDG